MPTSKTPRIVGTAIAKTDNSTEEPVVGRAHGSSLAKVARKTAPAELEPPQFTSATTKQKNAAATQKAENPYGQFLGARYAAKLLAPGLSASSGNNSRATVPLAKRQFFARFVFETSEVANRIRDELKFEHMGNMDEQDASIYVKIKSIDAPSFKISTETLSAYNKPRTFVKKVELDPTNVTFLDSVDQSTRNFWRVIYSYYFSNGNDVNQNSRINEVWRDSTLPGYHHAADLNLQRFGYNLRNKISTAGLFSRIEVYTIHAGYCHRVDMMNPTIMSMAHGNFDLESTDMAELTMQFQCDNAVYGKDAIRISDTIGSVFNPLNEGMGAGGDASGREATATQFASFLRGITPHEYAYADDHPGISGTNPISAAGGPLVETSSDEDASPGFWGGLDFGAALSNVYNDAKDYIGDNWQDIAQDTIEDGLHRFTALTDTDIDNINVSQLFNGDAEDAARLLERGILVGGSEIIGLPSGNANPTGATVVDGVMRRGGRSISNSFVEGIFGIKK